MRSDNLYNTWKQAKADIFWGEIAPCDHVVQMYDNDGVFMDALTGYIGGGINAGDCCLVIATDIHLRALEERLKNYGVYVDALKNDDRYIAINAEDLLSKFMVNGWPDEQLFMSAISGLFEKANKNKRRVRAFGEMVAILWAKGYNGATVQLEHLWNKVYEKEKFSLFCAYPKSGFTADINHSLHHICSTHSKMISGEEKQLTEVHYRPIEPTTS